MTDQLRSEDSRRRREGVAAAQEPREPEHHPLHAVRGHLLEMAGDFDAAVDAYQIAADRTTSLPEQQYLLTKAARLRQRAG